MTNIEYQKKFWENKNRGKRRNPNHPVVKAFAESKISFIKKHLDITPQTTLLDVGCGNGYFTVHWSKICDTTGLDYSSKMLENNPHNKLVAGDVNDLPFEDNSFDIVFCSNLLHHIKNLEGALKEMKRVARKNVIISEPNRNNPLLFLFAALKKVERGILLSTKNYLIKKGNNAGLKTVAATVSGLTFPNITRTSWLPLLKIFDRPMPMGAIIEIIFSK